MITIEEYLQVIVSSPKLHMRWLETLSHLENRGAHKIMGFQPKRQVKLFLLQHAAEEARHAFFFKRQIAKLYKNQSEERAYPLEEAFCVVTLIFWISILQEF